MTNAPLHILHPHPTSTQIPVRVVYYLTEEIMDDETLTSHMLAEMLTQDTAYAIETHRNDRKAEHA